MRAGGWAVGRSGGLAVGRFTASIVSVGLLLTARPPNRLTAQSRSWRPEDRVVVSDFSIVDAVAASPWVVYVATRHGLALYDRRVHAWQTPVTALDGYPRSRVRVALADPVGNAVWLGTDDGWARYDGTRWDNGPAAGGVMGLMLDARDPASGVFLRDPAGWRFLPRGGLLAGPGTPLPPPERRISPLDVQAALNAAPMAQAVRALVLTDPRLRSYQFTSAARPEDGTDLYFGTNGLGLVRIDPTMAQWEPLPFTLQAAGADALTVDGDGVWAVSAARFGGKSGLTWLPEDLSATRPLEPPAGAGFGAAPVYRVLASGNVLWIATGAGLFKVDPATGQTRRYTLGDGLPSEDVRALAPAPSGAWIGTTRGLAVTGGADRITHLGDNGPAVLSLLVMRETLWVGSVAGLGMVPPGAPEPVVPADVQAEPALHAPVVALARCGDTLVAVLTDQVAWRDPTASRWTVERPRVVLGTLTAAGSDAGGVWLGGTSGLAWWNIGRATYQRLVIPGDLPAPVRDVAATARWVWVATDSGVVRLRRDVIVGGR
jgi:ligand-binding sensor domain-containing protein